MILIDDGELNLNNPMIKKRLLELAKKRGVIEKVAKFNEELRMINTSQNVDPAHIADLQKMGVKINKDITQLKQDVKSEVMSKQSSNSVWEKPTPEQFIMLTDLVSNYLYSDKWKDLEAERKRKEAQATTKEELEALANAPLVYKLDYDKGIIKVARSWAHSRIPMITRRKYYDTLVTFLKQGIYSFTAKQFFAVMNVRVERDVITPAQLEELREMLNLFRGTNVSLEAIVKKKGKASQRIGYDNSVFSVALAFMGDDTGYNATLYIKGLSPLDIQRDKNITTIDQACSTLGYAEARGQILRLNNSFRKQPNNEYSDQAVIDELIRQINIIHYNTHGKGKRKNIPPRITLEYLYEKAGMGDSNTFISTKAIWKSRARLRKKLIAKLDELKGAKAILSYDVVKKGQRVYAFDIATAEDFTGKLK